MFRQQSFSETGINDVLKHAGVAKGSFYHYFDSKESFGLAAARRYSDNQVVFAKTILTSTKQPPAGEAAICEASSEHSVGV